MRETLARVLRQAGRLVVPDSDAFVAMASVRDRRFGICSIRTHGIVTDWGLASELVRYIARQRRSQLSILLEGQGYFASGGRTFSLAPGDAVRSDQSLHDDEGYAGSPAHVLILDWEGDEVLGPEHRGAARLAHLAPHDVARLSRRAARMHVTPPREWALGTLSMLRALGLAAPHFSLDAEPPAPLVAKLYGELATVRQRLSEHPALSEVADTLGVSERQARRAFDDLDRELGVGTAGWREYLADTRLSTAQQLLSIPQLPLARVARLSGFRSATALCHAFAERNGRSPGDLSRRLAERWELGRPRLDAREWGLAEALVADVRSEQWPRSLAERSVERARSR